MYFISDATKRKNAPLMSAFPKETRPFTEPVSATQDKELGAGLTMIDLIKSYYPGALIKAFSGRYGFLDRDNKDRVYSPGDTDPFVFSGLKSLELFRKEAHSLIDVLTQEWVKLGLPLTVDEDRKIKIPDVHAAWEALAPSGDPRIREIVKSKLPEIQFIVANLDIMKKACIVRTVSVGWWAVSYRGKTTGNLGFFADAIKAHKIAFDRFITSQKGKSEIKKYWDEYGDPLFSNCGYPFFSAEIDKEGNPVSKIKVVELFKGILSPTPKTWDEVLDRIDYKAGKFGMAGFPLTVAGLRRLQAGRKWIHQFTVTPSGMRTAFDEKGINSIRVAWMVPYIYNVLLSPASTVYKAWRMSLPGCNHSGDIKSRRAKVQREAADKKELWMAEADYSNYDRFIPVDIIREMVTHVSNHFPNSEYWRDASMYLFDKANLVWPDCSSVVEGNGLLFTPGPLGLMSGVKTTGDLGTIVNSIVNLKALALTKKWNVDDMVRYLTQYQEKGLEGSAYEYYNVQSDDTLIIDRTPEELYLRGVVFNEVAKVAGLKGSIELGDRFLMRHYAGGADRPVPARVWQNTLSNESPPLSEIIFLAGLASRTDGLAGLKTVDPFGTGAVQKMTGVEARFTKAITMSLLKFVGSEAAVKSKTAITLLQRLSDVLPEAEIAAATRFQATGSEKVGLDSIRRGISSALAKEQLDAARAAADAKSVTAWLYELYKDRNVPSAALILDELLALDPGLGQKIEALTAKEHAFFRYAADTLGVQALVA